MGNASAWTSPASTYRFLGTIGLAGREGGEEKDPHTGSERQDEALKA